MASSSQTSDSSEPRALLYKYKEIRFYCKEYGPTKLYTRERNSSKSKAQPTLERHIIAKHPGQTLEDLSAKYGHRFHYTDNSIKDLSFEEEKRNPPRILRGTRVRKTPQKPRKARKATKKEVKKPDENKEEPQAHTYSTPQPSSTPLSVPELPTLGSSSDLDFDFNTAPPTFQPSNPSVYTGYYINSTEMYEQELYSTLTSFNNDHVSGTPAATEENSPIDPLLFGDSESAEMMEMMFNEIGYGYSW